MSNENGNQNQPNNPYAPPTADVGFEPGAEGAEFIAGGRSVPAGNGLAWITGAWDLFKRQPGLWVGFAVIYAAIYFLCTLLSLVIPFVNILMVFVGILLTAGAVYSCEQLRKEGSFALSDLFIAFQRQTGPLLIVCLIAFGVMIVLMFISGIFFGGAMVGMAMGSNTSSSVGTGVGVGMMIIGALIMMVGGLAYGMAIWFAPALVIMHGVAPFEAIKMSFSACLKNILPGIVFLLLMGILMFISALPLLLGLLVTGPMLFISYYTSYRDVFLGTEDN